MAINEIRSKTDAMPITLKTTDPQARRQQRQRRAAAAESSTTTLGGRTPLDVEDH
jgi:hypothetical protein